MNTTTALVIVGVILLAVILIAIVAAAARSGRMRRPALKPLTTESRDRYANQWDRIETRFVDAPEDAVREADALLLAMLGERQHPLAEDRLPGRMRKARRLGSGREGKGGTEGMRLALLEYRAVIEEYGQPVVDDTGGAARGDRREIAS